MAIENLHLGDDFYKQVVLLESHGIETRIENDNLMVLEQWWELDGKTGYQWLNASNWSMRKIKEFLGY